MSKGTPKICPQCLGYSATGTLCGACASTLDKYTKKPGSGGGGKKR